MKKKEILTKESFEKLKNELNNLIKIERKNVLIEIKKAKERGDLSENYEYQSAKEKQKLVETRIFELENIINNCEIIEPSCIINKEKVAFSAKVVLKNLNNNEIVTYKIVGNEEESIKDGFISLDSPMAKALFGKSINNIVSLRKFNEIVKFLILDISY